jgi:hypothetical protein
MKKCIEMKNVRKKSFLKVSPFVLGLISDSLTSDELILQWQQDHAIIVNGPQNVINIANEERESTISPFYSPCKSAFMNIMTEKKALFN